METEIVSKGPFEEQGIHPSIVERESSRQGLSGTDQRQKPFPHLMCGKGFDDSRRYSGQVIQREEGSPHR